MTYEALIKDLQDKKYVSVYFLTGDEPYYIDKITEYIENNVLTPEEKSFNQVVLYGNDIETGNLINAAKRFPMISQYQVVIVKEAQNMKKIDDLVYYTDNPLKSTILVINYKHSKFDKRKKLYNSINKNGVFFESNKLYDNQIPDWITKYLSIKNYSIKPKAAVLLTEFLGNELSKIVNELDKLILTLPDNCREIDSEHIEKNIGISKEYNNFELQNALIHKDIVKANRIINYFKKNPNNNPIVVTITLLYSFFSKVLMYHKLKDKSKSSVAGALKINPYFVKDYLDASKTFSTVKIKRIISDLRKYDLRSKGVNNLSTSHGDLLKELIYKITH